MARLTVADLQKMKKDGKKIAAGVVYEAQMTRMFEKAGVDLQYGPGTAQQSAAADRFTRLEALYEASELTTLRATWLAGTAQPNNMESSVCKAHAGSAVRAITQGCVDLLGPMGISRDHLLEKWMRDCRITDIYEGTGEIQRLIIARGLLDYTRDDLK